MKEGKGFWLAVTVRNRISWDWSELPQPFQRLSLVYGEIVSEPSHKPIQAGLNGSRNPNSAVQTVVKVYGPFCRRLTSIGWDEYSHSFYVNFAFAIYAVGD